MRLRQRKRFEDAALLILMMEEGAQSSARNAALET